MVKLITLILIMTLSNTCASEIYKWVDEDGHTTYSEEKPNGKWFKKLKDEDLDKLSSTEPPKKSAYPIKKTTRKKPKQERTNLKALQEKERKMKKTCDRLEKKVKRAEKILRARGLGNTWARENKRRAQDELTDECWRKR